MTSRNNIAEVIQSVIPQWIFSTKGNQSLSLNGQSIPFWVFKELTTDFVSLKSKIEEQASQWATLLVNEYSPTAVSLLQEELTIEWLKIIAPHVNWYKTIGHMTRLSQMTFENMAITTNIIITDSGVGTVDITDIKIQKLVAPLSGTLQTYFKVDGELRLIEFKNIPWNKLIDEVEFKLYPEFLHPYTLSLGPSDVSIHLTSHSEILVLKRGGIRAARRKGAWHIYEPQTLKNALVETVGNYYVGCNVFEFLLDLSFRRHGALLIFDPEHKVVPNNIVNPASILKPNGQNTDEIREFLGSVVQTIRLGQKEGLNGMKRIMMELASMDGALVFDQNNILAIGAMIRTHPTVGSFAGARTTAARSALLYGARPIKVSADGDIDVFFCNTSISNDTISFSFL
jgi:hypothetical protein